MQEIPKNIFRKNPYTGIISQVAKENNISHTYVSKSFWNPQNQMQYDIKKRIIELMKERKTNTNDKLNKEILELLK